MGSEVAESLGRRAKSRLSIPTPLMMSVMSAPVLASLSDLRARATASQVWIRRPHERRSRGPGHFGRILVDAPEVGLCRRM